MHEGSSNQTVELTLSFLSPITPTSTLRQALPGSYLTVYAKGDFDVSVYIDLNGQWVSGDRDANIVWSLERNEEALEEDVQLKTFKVKRKHELHFTEHRQQAEWGELYFTGPADVDHECGTSADIRHHFAKTGSLKNKVDDHFRSIMDDEPVFAFSKTFNLSSSNTTISTSDSTSKESSVVFTIAHLQDPVTQFASARGLTWMRPLWKSYFSTAAALIHFHYTDYPHALALASNYSSQLHLDAYATFNSSNSSYPDLLALTPRQVLGATSFSGTPDNPLLFLKEISSNGNTQTVDVIFPSFPFFLYTQPRWLAYLLEPLLEHMGSGQYPNDYTMHDLGAHFPNFTGHPDGRDEYMPVEECGDILIMGLALVNSLINGAKSTMASPWSSVGAVRTVTDIASLPSEASPFGLASVFETSDGVQGLDSAWVGASSHHQARHWLARSYPLWKQWTSYLVKYSLYPENQLCTDDFAGWLPLMTNLALKGIVGIKAMSEMASVMGEEKDVKYYRNISEKYVKVWEEEGMARDGGRAKLAYNWYGSWTTLYSLFADTVLGFHSGVTGKDAADAAPSSFSGPDDQRPLNPSSGMKYLKSKNFIPHHIYRTQSDWYSTVLQKYGLPLDSRHLYTKSDWAMQAAAVAEPVTREAIVELLAKWVNETATDLPLTDLYRTEGDGGWPGPHFKARPVVGSFFAPLVVGRGG